MALIQSHFFRMIVSCILIFLMSSCSPPSDGNKNTEELPQSSGDSRDTPAMNPIPRLGSKQGPLDRSDYDLVSTVIKNIYSDVFEKLQIPLIINEDENWGIGWASAEANYIFETVDGKPVQHFKVSISKHFAEHPQMTIDGLVGLFCHEIGHGVGGAPYKFTGVTDASPSAEGQADYFSTLKCLRHIFELEWLSDPVLMKSWASKANGTVCADVYKDDHELATCARSIKASEIQLNLAQEILKTGNAKASFKSPSQEVASLSVAGDIYPEYPSVQCRLDTMIQGALCRRFSTDLNLGKDQNNGVCLESLGDKFGPRPRCWYREIP